MPILSAHPSFACVVFALSLHCFCIAVEKVHINKLASLVLLSSFNCVQMVKIVYAYTEFSGLKQRLSQIYCMKQRLIMFGVWNYHNAPTWQIKKLRGPRREKEIITRNRSRKRLVGF